MLCAALRSSPPSSRLAVALLVLIAAPFPVASQQELPGVFSEVLEVRVVNVEVVVTDRQGNRVTGLTADAFRLEVDGQEVPIEYFTEVRAGSAIDGQAGEGGPRRVPSLDPGVGVGTSYLVFIDEYWSLDKDRGLVLEKMREQLPLLGPEDRMAVVAYNGDGLEMLTSWSRNLETLDEVFRDAQARPAYGLQRYSERRSEDLLLRDTRQLANRFDTEYRLDTQERHYVERLTDQVERTVAAAASTLRSFAAPPGRKVMLLLAGGWPYDPVEFIVNDHTRPISEPGYMAGTELLSPLSDTANLLGYTLYPVDVPGLQATAFDTPTNRAVAPDLVDEVTSIGSQTFVRETDLHNSLNFLAGETGGRALINDGRTEPFSRVVSDTRTYYWIGFTPRRKGDDRRHRVEVSVVGRGLKVRSRDGFLDFSRSREVTMAVESALYFGNPPSPQPLLVQVGRPKNAGRRKMTVPLKVAIPVGGVTFVPTGPRQYAAQLELRVAVIDDDGATLPDIPVIPIQLVVEEPPRPDGFLRYDTALKMRRKPHDLVVALYDFASGTILSTAVEVVPH